MTEGQLVFANVTKWSGVMGEVHSRASIPDPFARLHARPELGTTPSGLGLGSGSVVAPAESIARLDNPVRPLGVQYWMGREYCASHWAPKGILSLRLQCYLSVSREPIFWLVHENPVSWHAKIAHH